MAKKKEDGFKIIADNRKARYAYAIGETLEAGIMLMGSEVKSLRSGKTTIGESYAHAKDGELWLVNSYIPEYTQASRFNHEPKRTRKLLVHKREAARLAAAIQREGMTLIPLKLYFNAKGKAKLDLATVSCMIFYLGVMLVGSISSLQYAIETGERRFSMWNPSMIPIKSLMVACIILMILQAIALFFKHLAVVRGEDHA